MKAHLSEVFDIAFREGCGFSLEDVLQSLVFGKSISYRHLHNSMLERTPDLALARRVGAPAMSCYLSRCNTEEALSIAESHRTPRLHSEQRVEIEMLLKFLGIGVLCEARKALPPDLCDGVTATWAGLRTPEARLEYLQQVGEMFAHQEVLSATEDSKNQPRARILPKQYLGWVAPPNCLGYAQIMASFASLTGEKFFFVSEVLTSSALEIGIVERFRSRLAALQERWGFPLDKDLVTTLDGYKTLIDERNALPRHPHFSILLHLGDERWALLDPYTQKVGEVPATWNISERIATFQRFRPALPGLSLLVQNPEVTIEESVATIEPDWICLESLAELIFGSEPNQVAEALANSDALSHFVQHIGFCESYRELPGSVQVANIALHLGDVSSEELEVAQREAEGRDARDTLGAAQEEVGVKCWKGIGRMPNVFVTRVFGSVHRLLAPVTEGLPLAFEIRDPYFGIGAAVLSHVGVDLQRSRAVEPALYSVAAGQHRIFSMAHCLQWGLEESDLTQEAERLWRELPLTIATYS